jgi:hypothetical protein
VNRLLTGTWRYIRSENWKWVIMTCPRPHVCGQRIGSSIDEKKIFPAPSILKTLHQFVFRWGFRPDRTVQPTLRTALPVTQPPLRSPPSICLPSTPKLFRLWWIYHLYELQTFHTCLQLLNFLVVEKNIFISAKRMEFTFYLIILTFKWLAQTHQQEKIISLILWLRYVYQSIFPTNEKHHHLD